MFFLPPPGCPGGGQPRQAHAGVGRGALFETAHLKNVFHVIRSSTRCVVNAV